MHSVSEFALSFLAHFCISLLSGYLSLSTIVATEISDFLGIPTPIQSEERIVDNTQQDIVQKNYQKGGAIPSILIENASLQASLQSAHTPRNHVFVAEDAVVNIFCTYEENNKVHATTGSGVFIDPQGIILTNAHVAQFLLLTETRKDTQCTVRQGNPAQARYLADLLYISPLWIQKNASLIDSPSPSGTGQRDYALLYVTKAITGELPTSYPFLHLHGESLEKKDVGEKVFAAGYPAKGFSVEGPRAELLLRTATTSITNIFTFGSGQADVLSIANSIVGEQGSSGGPILNLDKEVIGLIVTRGASTDGPNSLRAITTSYINSTMIEETGFGIRDTLTGNIPRRSQIFKDALAPFLASLLESEL